MSTGTTPRTIAEARALTGDDSLQEDRSLGDKWKILKECVMVHVTIGRWGGETKLTPDVLGLDSPDEGFREAIRNVTILGRQRLALREDLNNLRRCENAGRRALDANGYRIAGYDQGRLVPYTAYPHLLQELEAGKAGYFEARDRWLENYHLWKPQVLDHHRVLAGESYETMARRGCDLGPKESFVEAHASHIDALIPAKSQIAESFKWFHRSYFLKSPKDLEQEIAEAEEVRRQREYTAEQEHQWRTMQVDLRRQLQQRKGSEIDSLMANLRRQMLEGMYEITQEISSGIREKAEIPNARANKLEKLIARIGRLNFTNDAFVDEQLKALRSMVAARESSGKITEESVFQGIEDVNRRIRSEASSLLSRKDVRDQLSVNDRGVEMLFGTQTSRLRRDIGDASVPAALEPGEPERRIRREAVAA